MVPLLQISATKQARNKWVTALRSGNYQQAMGALHIIGEGYCCLGVACEVYSNENEIQRVEVYNSHTLPGISDYELYDKLATSLPPKVQDWLGLASNKGR